MADLSQNNLKSAEAIETWLATKLSEYLGLLVEEIDVSQPFADYGLSSKDAVMLSADLEDWLERRCSPTLAWEYPTIEALARHLAETRGSGQPPG